MTTYLAIGWFPPGQLEKARVLWPNLLAGWRVSSHRDYCREVDRHLRQLELGADAHVLLAPIEVKPFVVRTPVTDGIAHRVDHIRSGNLVEE